MQPPISLQTVLQNRYRLIETLGQGGFGRTYLAEDLGRFNELCALKELIPLQSHPEALTKAKQLFQKEASILYKIHHPQIPQFRATFEQDGRLFLVQDYVEGKTYWQLLQQKQSQGQSFTEDEIIQLFQQILPILAHLHVRGIIHRDISPDNIMVRAMDAKPVLIDFGIVNELANRLQVVHPHPVTTTVGKLGYAPIEQMQTGRAYASSDLYSLAVSAIVLLTGKQPPELFDDEQFNWNWQKWAKVSPDLAFLLNRMLSYKPSDRYQSVAEIAKAMQSLLGHPQELPSPSPSVAAPPQLEQNSSQQLPATTLSEINTIAIGRRPEVNPVVTKQLKPTVTKLSIWDRWWVIVGIFVAVALIAGGSSLLFVSWLLSQNQNDLEPQTFPSPLISPSSN